MSDAGIVLRRAQVVDADDIARVMRAALSSFPWMPVLHTSEEDRAFIRGRVLPSQLVHVAAAANRIVGFIAIREEWVEQLYLDPDWTGRGIGARLLAYATSDLPVVRLHCFQANTDGRRFYERHGFVAEQFGEGSSNEERLPDILYVRRLVPLP